MPLFLKPTRWTDARAARQGSRRLRSRRTPAHRRHRSHLGIRLHPRIGHSRQGQGPHAAVGVLVRPDRRRPGAASPRLDRRRTTSPPSPAAPGRAARPVDAGEEDRSAAGRVRRARIYRPDLAGRTTRRPARSAALQLPAGPDREVGPAAGAHFHARDEGRVRPRREHQRSAGRRDRRPRADCAAARPDARNLRAAASPTPRRAASSSRTQSSSSVWSARHADPHRRSADAGLVTLLAEGRVQAGHAASRASTNSSCATISSGSAGTNSRRCRRCPTT